MYETLAKPQKAFHKPYLVQDYYKSDWHKIFKKWRPILLAGKYQSVSSPPKNFAFQFQ